MNHLRIYDGAGRVLRELLNIERVEVWMSGALHVVMADRDAEGRLAYLTVASASWTVYEEWTGEPPARGTVYAEQVVNQPDPWDEQRRQAELLAEQPEPEWLRDLNTQTGGHPVLPEQPADEPRHAAPIEAYEPEPEPHAEDDGEARPSPGARIRPYVLVPTASAAKPEADPFLMLPDQIRLSQALTILCTCDKIRCPEVTDPATLIEVPAVRDGLPVGELQPLRRCALPAADVHEFGHDWREGAWPYGVAQHHPHCARWPGRYNVPGAVPMPTGLPASVNASAVLAAHGMAGAGAAVAEHTVFPPGELVAPAPMPDPALDPRCPSVSSSGYTCERNQGHEGTHAAHLMPGGDLLHW